MFWLFYRFYGTILFSMTVAASSFLMCFLPKKLFYYIAVSSCCQAVFWNSFKLISVIQLCPLPHSRQLHYYTLFHPSCQPVFESFFISFWSCCIYLQFAVIRGSGPILRAFKKEPGINWFQVPYYNEDLTIYFRRSLSLGFPNPAPCWRICKQQR